MIFLSLPSHWKQCLQPLDSSSFKKPKIIYNSTCNRFINNNTVKPITKLQLSQFLSPTLGKAVTLENALSGFRAIWITPFNLLIIPRYAYFTIENIKRSPILDETSLIINEEAPSNSTPSNGK
ncbi:hypothetical protein TNCV_80381 [Trichonephila clavipes]|nr:hypothetical protein TNCV_80381 [Trichonephila clavipes]